MTHRIGIYPGTFDPIHEGHIAFALRAMELCRLDCVVFLPETNPRGKQNVTAITLRSKALLDVCKKHLVLDVFIPTSSPFSVALTLPELNQQFPDSFLTLLLGSDVFSHLKEWPDVSTLLPTVDIVVGLRKDADPLAIKKIATDTGATVTIIELPETSHLSSRSLR